MSFVNRIYLLTACWSSIRVVQSASSREEIDNAIQGSTTPVTISLTADIIYMPQITVGDGKDVTIVSNDGGQKILQTADWNNRFFLVEAGGSLTLERITLHNCYYFGDGGDGYGGAIYSTGSLTVRDCTFSNNQASNGGAIYSTGSLTVQDCTFSNNGGYLTRDGDGGAIYSTGSLTVQGCTFSNNEAGDGKDIYHDGPSDQFSFVYSGGLDDSLGLYCRDGVNYDCPITAATAAPTTAAPTTAAPTTAAPTTAAPTTAAPTTAAPVEASSNGDPHLQFADGGSADFRGSHNTIYNMLTSDGISVNALFREQDFFLAAAGIKFARPGSMQGDQFLVHGTFIFETFTTVRTSAGRLLHLRTEAAPTSAANVAIMENNVPVSKLGKNEERVIDDVMLTAKDGRVTISTPKWAVVCTVVCTKEAHFLNLSFKHHAPGIAQSAPHGIIGQSYDYDGIAVDGAKDVYNTAAGGEFTTVAQAEGAIEGIHSDYVMESPFATAYKYSRFNNKAAAVRDIRKLAGTKKRAVGRERRKLAFLLQRMAGKENIVGAE